MRNFTRVLFTGVLLMLFASYGKAQKVTNTTINFKELAAYEAGHPELIKHCSKCEEEAKGKEGREADEREDGNESWEEINNPDMPLPSGAVIKKQNNTVANGASPVKMVPSKLPAQQWIGYTDPGNTIPPDTHGSVGINHVITATNDYIIVHAKYGGAIIARASISGFTGVAGTCDPYMTYDPTANRWLFSAINCSAGSDNPVILMVSSTADPLGSWRRVTWTTTPSGTGIFLDHPYLGFDNSKIVVSGRRFGPTSFLGTCLFLIDKAAMYAGTAITFGTNAQQIDKTGADGDAPLPVTVYDPPFSTVANPSPGTFYILQAWNTTSIRLTTVTGNIPAATWNTGSAVFPTSTLPAWNGNAGNVAEQMIEIRGVATNDDRISCGVMMNGKIWASHHIGLPATGTANRVAVQWWQLDGTPGATFGNVLQNGRVGGANAREYKWFSSIAVNKKEDVLIGYTASTNTSRINSAYVTRSATTPVNTTDDEVIYHAGEDRYWKDFGSGRPRWGDYSHTALDPSNTSLWTIQEYASAGAGAIPPDNNSRYGVWWANVVPASIPNLTINDVTAAEGNSGIATFTFTVTLDAPAPAGGVTFDIATVDGTATATTDAANTPSDYAGKNLTTQTIAAGATTYTFTVDVNGDLVQELDETFLVKLTNVTNALVTKIQALGTITNDDINPCANPTITAPAVVQPSCTTTTGSITFNATGSGAFTVLEYSLNGGAYQYSNVFNNLAAGSYIVSVRPHAQPTCITNYTPIVLNAVPLAPILTIVAESGAALCAGNNTLLRASELSGAVAGTPVLNLTPTSVNASITFNFKNNNAFPVAITDIASLCNNSGPINVAAYYKATAINGAVGPITAANGWNLFGTGSINGTGALQQFMTGLNLPVPPGATYGVIVQAITTTGTSTMVYNNGGSVSAIASNGGCDIITGPGIGFSGAPIPAEPTTTVRRFIGSVSFQKINVVASGSYTWSPAAGLSSTSGNPVGASPATATTYKLVQDDGAGCVRTASITITVNSRPAVTAQPVSLTVCAGSNATFTAAGTGTGFTYQWQESTNGGTSYTNITNAGIYSGATTGALTITGVTALMNGYRYRLSVSGTCSPVANSNGAILSVNALPSVSVTPTLSCGGVAGINGTKLKASGSNSYTWSPIAGLYTNATATNAYTGTTADSVYAAPNSFTTYTVAGTNSAGCSGTASAIINYTPNAPIINPAPANLCLGDGVLMLSKAQPKTLSFTTTVNVPIIDNNVAGANKLINVSGIPAGANITNIAVKMNATSSWIGDLVVALKAPNGKILNLDYYISRTNAGTGTLAPGFVNTIISSSSSASLGSGTQPYTGTFKADASTVADFFGAPTGPTGFTANTGIWSDLFSVPNGNWTLAWADVFPGADVGTFNDWSIDISYQAGLPSAPPVWAPVTYLFTDAAATVPYVAGTPKDTVYAKPPVTPLPGTYTYKVTAQSTPAPGPSNPAAITIKDAAPGFPYPSVVNVSQYPATGVSVKSVTLKGVSHTFSNDVDIILQSPTGQNVVLMSDVGGGAILSGVDYTFDDAGAVMGTTLNPSGVYQPTNIGATDTWPAPGPGSFTQAAPLLSLFGSTANVNGDWKLFVVDDSGLDSGVIANGWSIDFSYTFPACTSPERTVVVTLNDSVKIVTQPVNTGICVNGAGSFTAGATGTGLTYQWQVRTPSGTAFTNIANGGVYSGATSAALTITAPPASMTGNDYVCVVSGISPCGGKTTSLSRLTVNLLPTVTISSTPYTKLFPGLRTTLTSTSAPAAANYAWLKNGVAVTGSGSSLPVDVDGIGNYTLRVTDVNGCINTSNLLSITDSLSSKVFVYPSPTTGQFQVRYYSTINNTGLPRGVNIYDARGKRVLTQTYSIGNPYARMNVDLTNHGSGIYTVEVVDATGNRLAIGRISVVR
jgi:subtilisin-like proprotein convertase family protein